MIRPAKILFYNRVAKTGSQSITALLRALEKKNEFVVDSVNTKRELLIDTSEGLQLQLTKMLRTTTPMVFVQHYSFIDFSKFGYDWSPDWFNIVRDPIEKVISYFYYRRAGWVIADRLRVFPDDKLESVDYFKKDFESCVLQDDPECRFSQNELNNKFGDHRGQIMQFCGQEPVCRLFNNPEALQIAKKNVERHYAVVGITENMNMTLTVAEKKMPQYFRGAKKIYFNDPEVIQARSANFYKFPVSPEVKTLVRKKFKHEIEFYEFCKQRLIAQLNEL